MKRVHKVSFTLDVKIFRKLRAAYGNRLQKLCRKLVSEEAQRLDTETSVTRYDTCHRFVPQVQRVIVLCGA